MLFDSTIWTTSVLWYFPHNSYQQWLLSVKKQDHGEHSSLISTLKDSYLIGLTSSAWRSIHSYLKSSKLFWWIHLWNTAIQKSNWPHHVPLYTVSSTRTFPKLKCQYSLFSHIEKIIWMPCTQYFFDFGCIKYTI